MAYATIDDLQRRWRALTPDEQEQATTFLDDAADVIDSYVTIDPNDVRQVNRAGRISCEMVRRAMEGMQAGMYGATQASATMGPFNQQATFAGPSGELYLSKSEKDQLHAVTSFIASLRPVIQPVIAGGGCCADA